MGDEMLNCSTCRHGTLEVARIAQFTSIVQLSRDTLQARESSPQSTGLRLFKTYLIWTLLGQLPDMTSLVQGSVRAHASSTRSMDT